MRINIGCGQSPTPGWKNFDNSPSIALAKRPWMVKILRSLRMLSKPQLEYINYLKSHNIEYANAVQRIPIADASASVVYSSHMVEHLDRSEAQLFLAQVMRVLKPGGVIRLALPDIRHLVNGYLESGDADAFMTATRLAEPKPKTRRARLRYVLVGFRHHHWMYDADSLVRLLTEFGFEKAQALPEGQTTIEDPGPLDLAERPGQSVYVEARKPATEA